MLDPWVREHTGPACHPKAEGRGLWVFIPRMDSLRLIFFLIVFSPVAATGKCHLALRFHFVAAFLTPGVGRAAVVRLAGWPRCAVGCALGLAGGARTSSDPRASITRDRGWAVTLCALRAPAIARALSRQHCAADLVPGPGNRSRMGQTPERCLLVLG